VLLTEPAGEVAPERRQVQFPVESDGHLEFQKPAAAATRLGGANCGEALLVLPGPTLARPRDFIRRASDLDGRGDDRRLVLAMGWADLRSISRNFILGSSSRSASSSTGASRSWCSMANSTHSACEAGGDRIDQISALRGLVLRSEVGILSRLHGRGQILTPDRLTELEPELQRNCGEHHPLAVLGAMGAVPGPQHLRSWKELPVLAR